MIVDLNRFVTAERSFWNELEAYLNRLEADPHARLTLNELKQFHYLFERTSADLAKVNTFSSETELRRYLENLVARAYGEIHESRERRRGFSPARWFWNAFPQAFRLHIGAFWLSVAVTIAGCLFGGLALAFDPDSRHATMAFGHEQLSPEERVRMEESQVRASGKGLTTFSGFLIQNNIKVSIFTLALGMTYGIGTIVALFHNGVILGSICVDYMQAGQTKFLLGWILPHGSTEIPSILIAGQAGFILAGALIGRGRRDGLTARLREVTPDVATLIGGVAVLLVWAGIIEAFFSQYHEPVLPYAVKAGFGLVQIFCLAAFLARAGKKSRENQAWGK